MMSSRKLRVAATIAGTMLAAVGVAAVPTASAAEQQCTVTVTTAAGGHLTFVLQVPSGTPVSALSLPVTVPIASVSETCVPIGAATGTGTASSTPTSTSSTGTGTVRVPTTHQAPPKVSKPKTQKGSHTGSAKGNKAKSHKSKSHSSTNPTSAPKKKKASSKPTGHGGIPTPANPTYSYALPGPAPLGVPNFFIDSFQIPPFLLPIYQAAGIEYDVPWQVLAAINEIETDYGRNLSVSTAGAVGWMQFLPSTWKRWGVDANGDGIADPYNPVDAIFTAARYLQAAGAGHNLSQAIFAYNHAGWYVQSVLLRARLIGGMPSALLGTLTGLVEGHFPVAAAATYADDDVEKLASSRVKRGGNAAIPIESGAATGTNIYARSGAPVIAVNDGKIVAIGHSRRLGRYVRLQDETGNVYTYAHLGSVPRLYPVPKPVRISATQLARELSVPTAAAKPTAAASAGQQPSSPVPSTRQATSTIKQSTTQAGPLTIHVAKPAQAHTSGGSTTPKVAPALVKERLFADPARPASYAAGGDEQVQNMASEISSFRQYFSDVLHLGRRQYTLQPLRTGAIVVAGTILGRIARPTATQASHIMFQVQPAGKNAPLIDPKPILDGWKLLEATAVYRAAGQDPFFGPNAKNPSVGQVLLMSKQQLQERILQDPHVTLDSCTSRQVQAGTTDRRILAALEFLSASGLDPTATSPSCMSAHPGPDQASATAGSSIDITKVNNIPVLGHQGQGSITDMTIRRLLTLQGATAPNQIISLMSYRGQTTTLALPDHNNRIQVAYTPAFGANRKLTSEIKSALKPKQWIQLINRISEIPEPSIATTPSRYAIKTHG